MPLLRLICIIAGLTLNFNIAAEETDPATTNSQVQTYYRSLDPAFVVNVSDGGRVRHMQVQIQVEYRQPEVEEYLKKYNPAIRHEMIMLLTGLPVSEIKTVNGKQKLMAEALAAIQQVLLENINNTGIDAVYFTDLIIQ